MFLINFAFAVQPMNSIEISWRFKRLIGMSYNRGFIDEKFYQVFLYFAFTKARWLEENPEVYEFFDAEDDNDGASSIIASTLVITICAVMRVFLL